MHALTSGTHSSNPRRPDQRNCFVMKDYTGRITLVCAQASYAMSRVDPAWSPDSLVDQWENGRLLMKSSDATRGISARKSFVNDVVTLPAAHHGQVREVPRQKVSGYVIYCE
jgi:hypothetical protein